MDIPLLKMKKKNKKGFALVEILIAMTVLSVVLLSIFSSVSSGIHAMSGNMNHTTAMILAKSNMLEFISNKMRGPDLSQEPIEEHQKFYLTRITERYEHPLFENMPAKITKIIISWKEREVQREYTVSYIYHE